MVPLVVLDVGKRDEVEDVGKRDEVLPTAPDKERVGNIELELPPDTDNNEALESPCVNKEDMLGVNEVPPPPIVVVLLLGVEVVDVAAELLAATSDEVELEDICAADAATANEIGDVRDDELSADEDVGSIGSILY